MDGWTDGRFKRKLCLENGFMQTINKNKSIKKEERKKEENIIKDVICCV